MFDPVVADTAHYIADLERLDDEIDILSELTEHLEKALEAIKAPAPFEEAIQEMDKELAVIQYIRDGIKGMEE